ncbi:MAG: ABC transporter substrate-binding protein, partial [Chloroflexi bacterium]|nr:ABC transporter substrate-binding protein [Chloroflexota bacterium]
MPATGDAKYGGDIRMSAYADTKDWDPLGSGSLSSVQAYSQLYNQLVQFDSVDTTLIEGDLATSWEISNGGQTFTFHLAENARWHDGEDLTADDVVFAFSRYMDTDNSIGRSGLFRNYTLPVADGGIKKIDRNTVEMNLSFASGAFISFLALDYAKILPKHLLEAGVDLNQAENIIEKRAGSGPFVLEEYQRGNRYFVTKNADYFKEGLPFFDSIDHFIITDTGTLIAHFKAGQLDMMNGGFSNLQPTEYLELDSDTVGSSNGHITAHELGGTFNVLLMVNVKAEPFTDIRVRKAIY